MTVVPVERLAAIAGCVRNGDDAGADHAIARAEAAGVLRRNRDFLVPAITDTPFLVDDGLEPWRSRGFHFCLVKRHGLSVRDRAALSRLFGELRRDSQSRTPPVWITEHNIVTLCLPGAVDLRPIAGENPTADAIAVHRTCIDSLARLRDLEPRLRRAMLPYTAKRFPVAERHKDCIDFLAQVLGATAADELAAAFTAPSDQLPHSLFYDPKPANLLLPSECRPELWRQPDLPVYRVDLDMMFYETPLALQLILAYFAHPIAFEVDGAADIRLSHLVERLTANCAMFGCGGEDTIVNLLRYHLARNLAGAIQSANRTKAIEMAGLIVAGCSVGLYPGSRNLAPAMDRWLELNVGGTVADHG